MKEQAIIIFIPNNKKIDDVRKKYDRYYKEFKPHITLVYPFKVANQKKVCEHIINSIKNFKSFKIELKGLKRSAKEYYLYLVINKGKNNIVKLYKKLNSGILKGFENKKMPRYIPHVTLGSFSSKSKMEEAIKIIKKKDIKINADISKIHLLTFKKGAEIEKIKGFKLK
ncbi:MAG: 2'-5' RNA ligase family protein [Candidatus Pacearchaeota archaeon]